MSTPCTEVERLKGIESNVKEICDKLEAQAIIDAEQAKDIAYIREALAGVPTLVEEMGKNKVHRKMSWLNFSGMAALALWTVKQALGISIR